MWFASVEVRRPANKVGGFHPPPLYLVCFLAPYLVECHYRSLFLHSRTSPIPPLLPKYLLLATAAPLLSAPTWANGTHRYTANRHHHQRPTAQPDHHVRREILQNLWIRAILSSMYAQRRRELRKFYGQSKHDV
jgi:hypothetical protein